MRYLGTGTGLMVEAAIDPETHVCVLEEKSAIMKTFEINYKREYGFVMQREIIVDDVRSLFLWPPMSRVACLSDPCDTVHSAWRLGDRHA